MLSAPVLSWVGGFFGLSWVWTATNPDHWQISYGSSGAGPFVYLGVIPAVARNAAAVPGRWYVVQGMSAVPLPVTAQSNSVYAT